MVKSVAEASAEIGGLAMFMKWVPVKDADDRRAVPLPEGVSAFNDHAIPLDDPICQSPPRDAG
jgi:hypothetical protein